MRERGGGGRAGGGGGIVRKRERGWAEKERHRLVRRVC